VGAYWPGSERETTGPLRAGADHHTRDR
jgi:hypothetical protein